MSKISSFLTEYETSLADVRRTIRQMAGPRNTPITDPPVTPSQPPAPKVLTADEAKQYFNLRLPAPDYLLKITPRTNPESGLGYRLSFITPTDYEVHDDNTVTTPGGETLSRDEFEKQQEAVLKSQLEQYLTSFPDYVAQMPSAGPDPHPEWPTTMEYIDEKQKRQAAEKSDLLQYLSLVEALSPQDTRLPSLSEEDTAELERYLDSFSRQTGSASGSNEHYLDLLYQQVRDVFGKVISQDDIDEMLTYAQEDPEDFSQVVLEAGRNEDSEALLRRMFPDITDEEIDQFFTPQEEVAVIDEPYSGPAVTGEQQDEASGTEEPPKIPEDPQELWKYFQQNGIPWLNISAEEFNTKINDGYDLVENPDYGRPESPDRDRPFIWEKPVPTYEEPAWYQTLWRDLPINPYYWKSADEKNRMLWEDWARRHGVVDPPPGTTPAWEPLEPGKKPGSIPIPHTEFDPTLTPGERFTGEWLMPAFIPGGLARYPLSAAEKLLPKSLGKVSGKVLDWLVGKDTGSRLEQDFVNKAWANPGFSGAGSSVAERVASGLINDADSSDDALRKAADELKQGAATGGMRMPGHDEIDKQLRELYRYAIDPQNRTANKNKIVEYGLVGSDEAAQIKAATSLNIEGYQHSIDASSYWHYQNDHGTISKELSRGQVPVTEDDFALIPDVVTNPDQIGPARTVRGLKRIVYIKRIDGHVLCIEEAQTGNKRLATVTIWKYKGNAPDIALFR